MRISDWSSDVCSSDLQPALGVQRRGAGEEIMLNRTSKADVDRARREELMSELIDVETREVSMSVLADREVYDLEMKHIFADRKSTRLTPVTNAHLVCRLLLEKKNNQQQHSNCHTYIVCQ